MLTSDALEFHEETCYTFIIQTGADIPAKKRTVKWDNGSMILTINPGSVNESEPIKVREDFPMETEGAVTVDFWLPAKIGVPKLLKVDLEGNKFELLKDALFVRQITVVYNRRPYRFPAKNYIYPHDPMIGNPTVAEMGCPPHLLLREGAGTLKHLETEKFILRAREEDMVFIKSMVAWLEPKETQSEVLFPGHLGISDYSKLPRYLQFRECHLEAFQECRKPLRAEIRKNVLENVISKITGTYQEDRYDTFAQYADLVKETCDQVGWGKEQAFEPLKVSKVFHSDEEFGRQMLCGLNVLQLRKVVSLHERWADGAVPPYALEGKSLEDVIEDGHLFEINCDELLGISHGGSRSKELTGTQQTWYVVLADCLLYQRKDGKVVPVQIRLENRNDGEPATFWTPPEPHIVDFNDPAYLSWLYAKIWFRCADTNVQMLCKHFARAHATNEVFAVAVYRNLPNAHPMFRLLQPHVQGIIPINVQARGLLVNAGKNAFSTFMSAGDNLEKVFHNYYKGFSYQNMILPREVESRGLEDIPVYPVRDDMLSYWRILLSYVSKMVDLAYPTDEDVANDQEMQNVILDVADKGWRGFPDNAGFPREIADKEALSEYLTAIITNISVFHTAVNFQTFTFHAFAPNSPTCLTSPPPKQDDEISMETIMKCLPVKEIAVVTMAMCSMLGRFSPVERYFLDSPSDNKLGMLGEHMTVAPEQEQCIRQLIADLWTFQRKIDARNAGCYMTYDILSPLNTPITTQI